MRFRKLIFVQLFLVTIVTSGCQLMSTVRLDDESIPLSEKEKEVIVALKVHMMNDSWNQNRQWNLLSDSESSESYAQNKYRWKFGNDITVGFLNRIDGEWEKETRFDVKGRQAYPMRFHLASARSQNSVRASDVLLQKLASEDSLSGWNATILLGQRNPRLARRFVKTLEKLVTQQMYYDAVSGKFAPPQNSITPGEKNPSKTSGDNRQLPNEKIELTATSSLEEHIQHAKQIEKQPTEKEPKPTTSNRLLSFFQKKEEVRPEKNIKPVSRFLRLAAAEAWCRVLAENNNDNAQALAPAGKVLKNSLLPDILRAELFLGLAQWLAPNRIPRLASTFRISSDDSKRKSLDILRTAAIKACVIHAQRRIVAKTENAPISLDYQSVIYDSKIWPKRVMNAQFDPDAKVRQLFGLWLAFSHHPQALEITKSQLADIELQVRLAAIENLGILHTPEAFKLLNARSHRKDIPIRKYAMKGLAHWGTQNLGRFSEDESAEVREALSAALKKHRDASSAALLQKLLSDRSQKVQLAVIEAIRDWPNDWALPLLLHAMSEGTPKTSQLAFSLLQEKTEVASSFPISSHATVRRDAVKKLSEQYRLPLMVPTDRANRPFTQNTSHSEVEKERLKSHVFHILNSLPESPEYYAATESLHALDSSSVSLLETVLEETHAENLPFFTKELLPEISKLYRAVNDLESNEPTDKLRGIRVLEKHGMTATLSPIIVRRMLHVLKKGSDRDIWRSAMNAVLGDSLPFHAEVAKFAAHYFAPEIRILACRYFQRHRQPEFAAHLLELLEDQDYNVKMAAIEAAGYCPNPTIVSGTPGRMKQVDKNTRGLSKILLESDRELRTSAALSLARLGNETGFQELVRASFHHDRKFQEDAFRKMGLSGRRRFVKHLVRRSWSEKHPATRIIIFRSLKSLIPEEERPSGLAAAKMYEEKAKLWSNWLENRQGKRHISVTQNNFSTHSDSR